MMRASHELIDLVVELHQLGPGERRAILARLEPREREAIDVQLQRLATPPAPSFDALASLSPWLAESLAAARSADAGMLTPATREALLDAERLLPRDAGEPTGEHRPSLLQRLFSRKAL